MNSIQPHLPGLTNYGPHPPVDVVRVVDAGGDVWSIDDDRPGPARWTSGCAAGPYDDLALLGAAHGPLRPVVPAPRDDRDQILAALRRAGGRAVTTVHAALRDLHRQLIAENATAPPVAGGTFALQQMTAGDDGSWESECLREMVGTEPTSSWDAQAAREIQGILHRWATASDHCVEMAQSLVSIVSGLVQTLGPEDRIQAGGTPATIWLMTSPLSGGTVSRS